MNNFKNNTIIARVTPQTRAGVTDFEQTSAENIKKTEKWLD